MRTASLRSVTVLSQICTVWRTKLRKHVNAVMEKVFYHCSQLAWPCIRLHWRKKICSCSAHAKRGVCRVKQQWELGVRFGYLGRTEAKIMLCALFYCDLRKEKFQHVAFPFSTLAPHLTEQNNFFNGLLLLCTDESLRRTVHQ